MEISFYNNFNRVLEGELYFPLSEGQTVSRFAMDVKGKLREGVPVEKAKGRQVFENTERRMIDPGLLEWTKGNNFKARVYPIPAGGYKKVLIAYEQEMKDLGKGLLYILPLEHKKRVDEFSLHIEVLKQETKPALDEKNELANLSFEKLNESYIAQMQKNNYLPNKQLAFVVPKTSAYKKVWIQDDGNKNYFYIHFNPPVIREAKKTSGRSAYYGAFFRF